MEIIPTAQKIEFDSLTEHKGQYTIQPLYPGYGTTLGNALRRVLLSSIPGSAITSVKVNNVEHEFSPIDYVKEDVVDILLNLKQVNLSIDEENPEEPLTIKISKTGEGKVTAGDFKCPTQVKIANPDLHIATLTDKVAKLEIECGVEQGMGYLPTENQDKDKLEIGRIAVDAIFTPINHVNFHIEHVRVGEMTNWDKLILSIETNGTITCRQAFEHAVNILTQQFQALTHQEEKASTIPEQIQETAGSSPEDKALADDENKSDNPKEIDEEVDHSSSTGNQDKQEPVKKKRGRPKKED